MECESPLQSFGSCGERNAELKEKCCLEGGGRERDSAGRERMLNGKCVLKVVRLT